jgi:hypothetical protein
MTVYTNLNTGKTYTSLSKAESEAKDAIRAAGLKGNQIIAWKLESPTEIRSMNAVVYYRHNNRNFGTVYPCTAIAFK